MVSYFTRLFHNRDCLLEKHIAIIVCQVAGSSHSELPSARDKSYVIPINAGNGVQGEDLWRLMSRSMQSM